MMWPCKRLWLLFIVLLYLKDGRALGVWSKGLAWTWKASSFPYGAQISTAMKDESKTNPGALQSGIASQADGSLAQYKPLFQTVQGLQSKPSCVQATSKQEVPSVELARPYAWLQKQNGLTQPGSLPVTTIQPEVSNGSSTLITYSGSQGHGSTVYGSSQQGISQPGSAPAFVVTQQGSESAVSNGSTASNMLNYYSGPQIQSSTGNSLFQGLFTQYDGFQAQKSTNLLGSAPALTVTQQAPESSIMPNGSSSFSSSYSGFQTQTPTANWLSVGFSSPYANFQMQHEVNQPGSVPVIAAQQASLGGTYNGSMSSSYSGSQSQGSTVYGLSQGIGSQFSQFQAQQGKKQCDSVPALTVTQQALQDATTTSGSSTSSLTSPYTDTRSPIASWTLQMLSDKYVGSQQGNQVGSFPEFTVTQQASEGALSMSSTSSSHSSSQSQGSTFYGPSQGLASQYNFQTQQGQLSPTPALVIQQALQNVISNDPKTSTSYSDSQNQGTTGYGLSQGLSSQYSGFQVHQDINQHGSVPALTVTQQVSASGIPSGPTTSGMSSSSHVGSQNPFTYWLSLGLPSPYASFQTQHVQQLGSLPRLVAMQPATAGTISNDSSTSIFYSDSQYAASQGQSVKQPGSMPGLPVIQQASANAIVNVSISSPYSSPNMGPVVPGLSQGSASQSARGQLTPASVLVVTQHSPPSGSSTSYNDSPIQGTTAYGLIQRLSNQYSGFQTQQDINRLGSVPALTVTQQASASRVSSSPTTSGVSSGSHSGSKNPFTYWLYLGLPSPYANFQTQQSVGQLVSMPQFTTMQPIKSTVSNGSSTSFFYGGSPGQVSTGYGLSQGLASQYGEFQPQQSASQLSNAPAFILTQQASESAVSSGSTSNTSTSYSDSPTQGSTRYGLFEGLSSQYGRLQTLQGTNQPSSGSSSYSGSQGQPTTSYGPSLWLSNLYGSLQAQQGVQQAGSAPSLPLNQQDSESTISSVSNSVPSGYSASQSHSSSSGPVGSALSIQSQNVQKLGAFNQQVPALWLGQQYCKNLVYSASSDNSPSISGSKSSMGNISS
ncbi:mucin-17 [Clarias gariepinus]|uniref:mucin-17 n=1 Tax=Clarias gariepinus TaxID=13013 RepID=UPI00234C62BD|nr:mucin-17 [Clarias gariepinus]